MIPRPARVPAWRAAALLLALALLLLPALPALPGGTAAAHPPPAREPVSHHMRGPGPGSARWLPLTVLPPKTYLPARPRENGGPGAGIFQGLLGFYRTVISPVDGDRCVMAPTCSLYSHQAIQEHGALLGVLLTADRLLHEADEIGRVPRIRENGETLYLDPLEANTYWWWEWLK